MENPDITHGFMADRFSTRVPKQLNGEKTVFLPKVLRQLDMHKQKNEVGSLPHHTQKLIQNVLKTLI